MEFKSTLIYSNFYIYYHYILAWPCVSSYRSACHGE